MSNFNENKILVVDDDELIHKNLKIILSDILINHEGFSLIHAYSNKEAKEIVKNQPNIAVIVLDVMMEEDDAGLNFIKYLRNELQNLETRIILHTGKQDIAPKKEISEKYQIDSYIDKNKVDRDDYYVCVNLAIRNYQQVNMITKYLQSVAGSIAHEFRNPLHVLQMGLSNIKRTVQEYEEKLDKKDYSKIEKILTRGENVCKRTDTIINLTLQNVNDKKIDTSRFRNLSIVETINKAIDEYPFSSNEQKQKIKPSLTKDFTYNGNETLMVYLIFNLFKNTLYYISNKDEGYLNLTTEEKSDFNYLYFKDNGPGISKDRIPYIFDDFKTYGKEKGTGLGLSFCKRVMKSFGGDIVCESELGKYTQFVLKFPK